MDALARHVAGSDRVLEVQAQLKREAFYVAGLRFLAKGVQPNAKKPSAPQVVLSLAREALRDDDSRPTLFRSTQWKEHMSALEYWGDALFKPVATQLAQNANELLFGYGLYQRCYGWTHKVRVLLCLVRYDKELTYVHSDIVSYV